MRHLFKQMFLFESSVNMILNIHMCWLVFRVWEVEPEFSAIRRKSEPGRIQTIP